MDLFFGVWYSCAEVVVSFDDFKGGVGDVPDWFGETPVYYLVEVACVEADGGCAFAKAGEDLKEVAFAELDVVEC